MTTQTMRPYAGETDLQAIADFLNACEAVDKLDEWTSVAELRVEFDTPFAAFCYCHIHTEENTQRGRNEGWIAILGTRRGFRRIGLGRAMLLAGMHQLKAAGMDTAKLGVDAQNPNGALRLYESVGFCQLYTRLSFVKDV